MAGRMFRPAVHEVIVGKSAVTQFKGVEIGDKIPGPDGDWTVVGIFESDDDVHQSEILGDADTVLSAYRRNTFNSVTVQLVNDAAFTAFKDALTSNPAITVDVMRETDYYESLSKQLNTLLTMVAYWVGGIMALGAIFGALNTMYAAVSTRTVEIATLRAVGFGAFPVVVSVLVEALLLAAAGAVIGGGLGWLGFNGNTQGFGGLVFKLSVNPAMLMGSIIGAEVIGFIGGFFPASRAARLPVATATPGPVTPLKFIPLVWAGLWRKRVRTVLTMLSIVTAFLLFGLLQTIRSGIRPARRQRPSGRGCSPSAPDFTQMPLAYMRQIEGLPGVKDVAFIPRFGGYWRDPKNSVFPNAVDPDRYLKVYSEFKLPKAQYDAWVHNRTAAVVGLPLMQRYGWKIGDRIPHPFDHHHPHGRQQRLDFRHAVGCLQPRRRIPASACRCWSTGTTTTTAAPRRRARWWKRISVLVFVTTIKDYRQAAQVSEAIDDLFANSTAETRDTRSGTARACRKGPAARRRYRDDPERHRDRGVLHPAADHQCGHDPGGARAHIRDRRAQGPGFHRRHGVRGGHGRGPGDGLDRGGGRTGRAFVSFEPLMKYSSLLSVFRSRRGSLVLGLAACRAGGWDLAVSLPAAWRAKRLALVDASGGTLDHDRRSSPLHRHHLG